MQKSLVANAFYNIVYKLLNVLFPLISIAIISRALLPIGVGKVSSAQNIVTYFTFLAPLGLASYGTREIAKADELVVDQLFSELVLINTISTSVCAIIYYTMVVALPCFNAEKELYLVTGISIILNYFNVDWFYQGKEQFKYIALRSTLVKALMLATIIVFVHSPSDYKKYALIHVFAIGGNYIFNIFHIQKYNIKLTLHNLRLKRHLKALLILLATNIAVELYSLVDTTMLTAMCSSETVAYYTNAMRLVKVAIFVITAIGGVALPRIMSLLSEKRYSDVDLLISNFIKVMLLFAFPCGVGMMCLSDTIVYVLFGEAFAASVNTVIILSLLFFFLTFSNFLGTQILVAFKREKDALIATVVGAVVNIGLNSILIKMLEHNGAAIASIISECVVLGVMWIYAKGYFRLHINSRFIVSIVVSCLAMAVAVLYVKNLINNIIISLPVCIFTGAVLYGCIVCLFNKDLVKLICSLLKNNSR